MSNPERRILTLNQPGARHGHVLRIVAVEFPDGEALYLDVSEPGGCGCSRRVALSEVVHLLLNVTDEELLTVPNRDRDPAGHAHGEPAP